MSARDEEPIPYSLAAERRQAKRRHPSGSAERWTDTDTLAAWSALLEDRRQYPRQHPHREPEVVHGKWLDRLVLAWMIVACLLVVAVAVRIVVGAVS